MNINGSIISESRSDAMSILQQNNVVAIPVAETTEQRLKREMEEF